MAKDWSNLPADLIGEITRFLTIQENHRLGAVCRSWGAVVKLRAHSPTPQLPWIAFGEERHTQQQKFFSLSELKHYCIDAPDIHGMTLCGSKLGWLFAVDKSSKFVLVNPLKQECHELPSPPPCYDGHLVLKATINRDPRKNSKFTVVVLCENGALLFWEPGNQEWTNVTGLPRFVEDIELFEDKLYIAGSTLLNEYSVIHTVDLKLESTSTQVGPLLPVQGDIWEAPDDYDVVRHLADFGGVLYLIERYMSIGESMIMKELLIHKLDMEGNEFVEAENINGCALFLGKNSPIVIPKIFPGCKNDTLYFADPGEIASYDIGTRTITPVYPHDLAHETQAAPLWFTPNHW